MVPKDRKVNTKKKTRLCECQFLSTSQTGTEGDVFA